MIVRYQFQSHTGIGLYAGQLPARSRWVPAYVPRDVMDQDWFVDTQTHTPPHIPVSSSQSLLPLPYPPQRPGPTGAGELAPECTPVQQSGCVLCALLLQNPDVAYPLQAGPPLCRFQYQFLQRGRERGTAANGLSILQSCSAAVLSHISSTAAPRPTPGCQPGRPGGSVPAPVGASVRCS